jgi:transcriptional regulator with XRE-family HTH domain
LSSISGNGIIRRYKTGEKTRQVMAQTAPTGIPTIGTVIRAWRIFRGFTSTELAEKAGVRIGYLSEIEHNRTANPKEEYLVKLADALEVPLQDIYGRRMPPKKRGRKRLKRATGPTPRPKQPPLSQADSDVLAATGTFGSPSSLEDDHGQQLLAFEEQVRQLLTSFHLPYAQRVIAQQMSLEAIRIICWGLRESTDKG